MQEILDGMRSMKTKPPPVTDTPGSTLGDDEIRAAFVLDTGGLSLAERATIWRSYATAVVGLCKDVDELKRLVEDDRLSDLVAELIVDEWMVSANWHQWCRETLRDLERQVEGDPQLREKLEELRAEPR